jgi:type I restriction enzyme S subunit
MKNWQETTLGEITDIIAGQSPESKYYNKEQKGLPFYQGKKEFTEKFIGPPFIWTTVITKEAFKNDILLSVRAPVGPINYATEKCCIGRGLAAIRVKNNITREFIFYYLLSIQKNISGHDGVVFPSINRDEICSLKLKIPIHLSEQKRIVKILDKAFEDIEKIKENAKQNLQNSNNLFQSYLNKIFTENTEKFDKVALGKICKFVRGPFGGSLKKSIFVDKGYAVYEQQHAIYNQFDDLRYFISKEKFDEMKRFEVKSGDLIISCSGTMGKIAIVPQDIKRGIINQALLKLTVSNKIDNVFLKLWLESPIFQKTLSNYSKGVAIKNLVSVSILKEITINLPRLSIQKQIVKKLDMLQEKTKRLEAIYNKKLQLAEELKQSILHKAFNGDL